MRLFFRPLSVSPLANSTWEWSRRPRKWNQAETSGRPNVVASTRSKGMAEEDTGTASGLMTETQGTSGDRPPSGICHWISLTPWWETQRLYNVCLPLSLSLFASMTGNCHQHSLLSCSSTTLSVLTPHLSPYISVWSEDRRESAVGLCTESC